jgi:3-phosphoshikimate 1-carboxyvinyltransferase
MMLAERGVSVTQDEDSIRITGGGLQGGSIEARGSLRLAMAAVAAGLCCAETLTVNQSGALLAAYPDFVEQAQRAGLNVHKEED